MQMIKLCDIKKDYLAGRGRVAALRSVSLDIAEGDFLSIVGASGSGKSTLMHILGCLDVPSGGEYYLDGVSVSSLSPQALSQIRNRKIGFVFQNFRLLGKMTAIENVEMPLIFRGMDETRRRARAAEALESVGLAHRMRHRPWELSGGQQQRVAIARAIVTDPALILADEPTGNLDTSSGEEILELLAGLNRRGCTMVLITHDPEVAARTQRHIRIVDGRIAG